jgi:hypothetical protein
MADFMRKELPDNSAEHLSKYVVEQESDTPVEFPAAVIPKHESRNDDADAETIDLRALGTTPRFGYKQYGIRKGGTTLMIGNSAVDFDNPGFITVKGKQIKLTRGLLDLLKPNDVDTAKFRLMIYSDMRVF